MELNIKNVFTDNQRINNVIAEIPGADPKLKNEIVDFSCEKSAKGVEKILSGGIIY